MANLTTWQNNDVKNAAQWSAITPNKTAWTNTDTPPPTQWTNNDVKSPTLWSGTGSGSQSYFYDDPYMTYDMPNVTYDSLLNGNQLNQRVLTHWSQA